MEIGIKNLKKSFEKNKILDIEELNFKSNTIHTIMGRNGVGKTTLLNILANLDKVFEGKIVYNGKQIDKSIMKNITLVSQKPYMFRQSVFENIAYPLKIRKIEKSEITKRVKVMLEELKIDNLELRRADKLSGGEMQKVSLARGLIFSPQVLLLDEFTSNIDESSIENIEKAILKYKKEAGANIILVTHDRDQSDRIGENRIKLD